VVEVVTTVVTPPTVLVPDETEVEVAAQTVVDSVRVTVVAGIVYTPGVGQVVANGVGTTGDGELEGATAFDVDGGGGGGAELDLGVIPITKCNVSPFRSISIMYLTYW
jgi:hypothetical protein